MSIKKSLLGIFQPGRRNKIPLLKFAESTRGVFRKSESKIDYFSSQVGLFRAKHGR